MPMVVRRKRGCHSGASPSLVGCSFLDNCLGCQGDNPQVRGIIVAISKGGSDKYGVSNPQGAKGKINILSSPICH